MKHDKLHINCDGGSSGQTPISGKSSSQTAGPAIYEGPDPITMQASLLPFVTKTIQHSSYVSP